MHIPIEADELENISKPALLNELKIRGICCKSNMKKVSIKEKLKEAVYNKVVLMGDEEAPPNTNKKKPKFKSTIGRGSV